MNVKIDINTVEEILKAYSRRDKNQIRVYGLIIGTATENNTYIIKTCIYGFMFEEQEGGESRSNLNVKKFRLNF